MHQSIRDMVVCVGYSGVLRALYDVHVADHAEFQLYDANSVEFIKAHAAGEAVLRKALSDLMYINQQGVEYPEEQV